MGDFFRFSQDNAIRWTRNSWRRRCETIKILVFKTLQPMNKDKVSVIIPVYNVEKYLDECIQSVRNQTYTNLEIIIINDGSTDNSLKIAERHALLDPRVHLLSQPNLGLSDARNVGIGCVSGQWLVFIDGDDMLFPNSILLLYSAAQKYKTDIAIGEFTRRNKIIRKNNSRDTLFTPTKAIFRTLYQNGLYPSVCGKLFRRDLFKGLKFRSGIYYEDLDVFYLIYCKSKRIIHSSSIIYYYRQTPNSILNWFSPKRLDVLEVTRRIEEWAQDKSADLVRASRDRRLSANFNILGLLAANDALDDYSEVACTSWTLIKNYRFDSLINPHVRLKNKIGILASYLGKNILLRILKRYYS